MVLEIAAYVVFAILIFATVAIVVTLGSLPGRIAHNRNHPQAQAVEAAGWIGLLTGVLWPIAFVWAFFRYPDTAGHDASDSADTSSRLAAIESRLSALEPTTAEPRADASGEPS